MGTKEDLAAAITQAVNDTPHDELLTPDSGKSPLADELGIVDAPAAPAQGGEGTPEGTAGTTPAPKTEAPKGTVDERAEFWGLTFDGVPADKQAEILAKLEGQESYIHKLQERLAKEPERFTPPAPEAEPTDEELLAVLGVDPEQVDPGVAQTMLQLGRSQLMLEAQLESLNQSVQGREVENTWNGGLDELESTYGKLPAIEGLNPREARVRYLQYAADEGYSSPYELYFRVTAPVKSQATSLIQEARRAAGKREAGGQLKPSSSESGEPTITKDMSLKEAVERA